MTAMENELLPIPEYMERARGFANAVLALKPKIEELGMILDNVMEHATDLGNEMDAVADDAALSDFGMDEGETLQRDFNPLIDADDQQMTEKGYDVVATMIDDPQKRDDLLRQIRDTMIDPLALQFAGTKIDDSIDDARSARSRIAEILSRAGVSGKSRKEETVRRLLARY